MRKVSHLPGRADGSEGLISLADSLGDATVFNLIRRCRTAQGTGNDPAGDTLTILANRIFEAELKDTDGNVTSARKAAAAQVGYRHSGNRTRFYRVLGRAVTTEGDEELLTLAHHHGNAAVYDLILLCRTARDADQDAGREALTTLARRMVDAEIERASVDPLTARQTVSTRLGYTPKSGGNSRSNFTKILDGGRPPETRPHSSVRSKDTQ